MVNPDKASQDSQDAIQLDISNEQNIASIDQEALQCLAKEVLLQQKIRTAKINVIIVENKTIHKINNEFLQHDAPTDVITFPMSEPVNSSAQQPLEGEIVISAEMAKELAATVGWQLNDEISLYLIHGLLHLCGFDDLNESDQILMRREELRMLRATGITPHLKDTRWENLDC